MAWTIKFTDAADKQFFKFNKDAKIRIIRFLEKLQKSDNPRFTGKALQGGAKYKFWRYRVGDYRIICHIEDKQLQILLVKIGHRKEIYD